MTPTFVQLIGTDRVDSGPLGLTLTITPSSPVAAGDLVAVAVCNTTFFQSAASITDSQGNAYTAIISEGAPDNLVGGTIFVSRLATGLGLLDAITIAPAIAGSYVAAAAEFSGAFETADSAAFGDGSGLSSGGHTTLVGGSGSIATSFPDDLIVGIALTTDTGATPFSPPAGWTTIDQLGDGSPAVGNMIFAYRVEPTAGSYDPQFGYSGASSSDWAEAFVSLPDHLLAVTLEPSGWQEENFGSPTLADGHDTLLPSGWQEENFGAPTLTTGGTMTISPPTIGPDEHVGAPILITAPPHVTGPPPPRNYLIDPKTGEVYPWKVNHSSEDPIRSLGRRLTRSGITASGKLVATRKVFLVRQPSHPGPVHLVLHGSMTDPAQDQYHRFVRFFEESDDRTFVYIDAAGDAALIAICQFDARRKMSPAHTDASYFTYTLEVEVIQAVTGPYRGIAV